MLIKTILFLTFVLTISTANILKKGEKIYTIMCDKEKVSALSTTDVTTLKREIKSKNICGNLKEKELDALVMFLSKPAETTSIKPLSVPEKSRCPVCGMFTAKYPKWVAIIEEENGHKYYFDGVKDMMKFYFNPVKFHKEKKPIKKILVSDYYTLGGVLAKEAYYVTGSNIYGPMGEELIPFKSKADAENFMLEHHGKKILTFDMIQEKILY